MTRTEFEMVVDLLDAVQKNPHMLRTRQCELANIHKTAQKRMMAKLVEVGFITESEHKGRRGKGGRRRRPTFSITHLGASWKYGMQGLIAIYRAKQGSRKGEE